MLEKADFEIMMDLASIQAHYELNIKALKAGKHLYSQKPMALTIDEATDLIETAKASNLKISASPIHMLRPDIREAKRLINGGVIGDVKLVRSMSAHGGPEYFQYRANDPSWFYEPGAGALYDMGVHALHQVTGLLGPAKTVSCTAAISSPSRFVRSGAHDGKHIDSDKLFDNYMINLDFGGGTIANIITGFCVKATNASSLEVYGERGSIIFSHNRRQPLEIYVDDPDKKIRGWIEQDHQERPAPEFFQAQCMSDLTDAIENDRQTGLPAEHARHVIDLIIHIERSAKEGRPFNLTTTF
jgi:predicted dehydrogenase